ncbi:hydroxyisourate hydrolase [Deinococcus altitudinis]|uniref:hydroxyisourate hydrolase n=1 Tax=Deinococcus altitudinis TaxID=468914 RepID=UPI00389220C9
MSGGLTTHVLDTARGRPASGLNIQLFRLEDTERTLLKSVTTNADGRTDAPLIARGELRAGVYELVFDVAAYFAASDLPLSQPAFLTRIPVRFGVAGTEAHYHVPLLVSPWAYSTYRGS